MITVKFSEKLKIPANLIDVVELTKDSGNPII